MDTATKQPELSAVEQKLRSWQPNPELPSWFNSARGGAIEAYFDLTPPDRTEEAWHYGDPGKFGFSGLDIAHAKPGFNDVSFERICGLTGRPRKVACLSMVGQDVEEVSSSTPLRDAGITVMALRQALALRSEQIEEYWLRWLSDYQHSKLLAGHYALVDNGFYVHVPKGTTAPEPIHLIMESGEAGSVVAPHVLIAAEDDSQAEVFIHFLGKDSSERNLQLGVTQTHLGTAAKVTVTKIQHIGERTDILTHEAAAIGRDAHYTSISAHFGGRNTRHEADARLMEPGSHADLLGIHLGRGRQRFDFHTHQHHQAPDTGSNLMYKGAMLDKSRASYQGMITVTPEAQRTDAYQTNRNLLLSDKARADSSPQLEIKADDVRCSHGSTTRNVREDELFYMLSRGIDPVHARQLLVSGFMAEVADRIPQETIRDYVYNYVFDRV